MWTQIYHTALPTILSVCYRAILIVIALLFASAGNVLAQNIAIEIDMLDNKTKFWRESNGSRTEITPEDVDVCIGNNVVVRVINANPGVYSINSTMAPRAIVVPGGDGGLAEALKKAREVQQAPEAKSNTSDKTADALVSAIEEGRLKVVGTRFSITPADTPSSSEIDAIKQLLSEIKTAENDFNAKLHAFDKLVDASVQTVGLLSDRMVDAGDSKVLTRDMVISLVEMEIQIILGQAKSSGDILNLGAKKFTEINQAFADLTDAYDNLRRLYLVAETISKGHMERVYTLIGATPLATTDWSHDKDKPIIEQRFTAARNVLDVLRTKWSDHIKGIATVYDALLNASWSYRSETPADSDVVDVEVKITDHGTTRERANNIVPRQPGTLKYTIPVCGGWKFNGSVGFGAIWMEHSRKRFYVDAANVVKFDNISPWTPAVITMAHAYYRASGWITAGITAGVTATLTDPVRPGIFAGTSLIIGKGERFVLTGGTTFGAYTGLNTGISENTTITSTQAAQLTSQKWGLGAVFGFSVNLVGGE